jgi:hypothetical protein
MTDKEKEYNILIGRLREAKPVAGNPELMTDEIMLAISSRNQNTAPRLLVWMRPLMTAAALFLFGLFLYQQFESTDTKQDITIAGYIKPSFHNKTNCSSASTLNLSENSKLLKQYICYMRSNIAENENSKQVYQQYLLRTRSLITQ